jgi:catechol-2,3-dioxygenase
MRLGHINLVVSDIGKSTYFYRKVLAFQVQSELPGKCVHFTFGGTHHEVSLFQSRPDLRILPNRTMPRVSSSTVGCYRLAFEATDVREFFDVFSRCESYEVELLQTVDYEVSWAFSFYDPDGNEVEIFLDRTEMNGGQMIFRGVIRSLNTDRLREEALGPGEAEQIDKARAELDNVRRQNILRRHGYNI